MESTKEDPARGTPDRPTYSLPSDQDSRRPASCSSVENVLASSSIRVPTTERLSTTANTVDTKQAGSTSAERQTQNTDQGQQPKSPSSSSNESKVSLTEDIQLLGEDPFSSEQSKALFDAIDELRICGAGQDLDLPQVSHYSS
jgi:hypothetical protein